MVDGETPAWQRGDYVKVAPHSAIFRAYYEAQGLFATQEEFETFYSAMRTTLPAWFRLTGCRECVSLKNNRCIFT